MPTQQQDKPPAGRDKHEAEQLTALIGKQVILALGQPGDFHRVQVRRLWENRYRVNVLVGADITSTKVAHSYFLVADGDGNISTTIPEIRKQY